MSKISVAEQARRHRMMQSVLGTHAMEGMFPDEETLVIMKKYEAGEFTMEDYSAAMDDHARSLVKAATTLVAVA